MRIRLKEHGIKTGVPFLFSNEITDKKLMGLNEAQEKNPDEYRPLDNMRVRIIPVIGIMPAIFGQSLASYVLGFLAGEPFK